MDGIRGRTRLTPGCGYRLPGRGFTLIELLVVIVIIGLISAGAILSFGTLGRDRELDRESDRLLALMRYAREQAELQTREFGLLFVPGGYTFVIYDAREGNWKTADDDDVLRRRTLPDGIVPALTIEGRDVLIKAPSDPTDVTPQIMIFSNGDLTSFEVRLDRDGGAAGTRILIDSAGRITSDAELAREQGESADSKTGPQRAAGEGSRP